MILVHPFPPMVPHLSPSKKSVIFKLHQNGTSNRKIAQRFNCHHTTISRIIVNMEKSGTPYYVTPGRGRKSILDERILRLIEQELFSGCVRDVVEARKNLDLSCDASTIRKALNKFGLHGRVRRKKPLLKPIHVRKRKAWALKFTKWSHHLWHLVWFSDELKYNLFGSDGKKYCWRRVGEEFLPRNTTPTVKGSGGKVNVWGIISYHGVGRLHCVIGNMDSEQLEGILEDSLLRSFDNHHIDPTYPFYAMDNDPKHSSRRIQGWFKDNGIKLLEWPAYSPDMNIIEHVWAYLETRVRRRKPLPTNSDQLWEALQDEWYSIPIEYIHKLYDSIPTWVIALKRAGGHSTKY